MRRHSAPGRQARSRPRKSARRSDWQMTASGISRNAVQAEKNVRDDSRAWSMIPKSMSSTPIGDGHRFSEKSMLKHLERRRLADDDPGSHRDALVQIDQFRIGQAEAARRNRAADRVRLVRAMDAIDGAADVERARAHRIARAAGHEARQVGLARDHLRRRGPVGPLRLAVDPLQSGPLETLAPDSDPVSKRAAVALHHIEKALLGMNDNRSRRLRGAEEDHLPAELGRKR